MKRELPGDNEVAESLHRAQIALKRTHGGDVHYNMKFGGEVEEVSSLDKFKDAVSSLGKFLMPISWNIVWLNHSCSILQSTSLYNQTEMWKISRCFGCSFQSCIQ